MTTISTKLIPDWHYIWLRSLQNGRLRDELQWSRQLFVPIRFCWSMWLAGFGYWHVDNTMQFTSFVIIKSVYTNLAFQINHICLVINKTHLRSLILWCLWGNFNLSFSYYTFNTFPSKIITGFLKLFKIFYYSFLKCPQNTRRKKYSR